MKFLEPSSRVALTALLHDLGKLAERAGIAHDGRLDAHRTLYCPWRQEGRDARHGYHSHVHAAYTALAWDALEATAHFPDLRRNCAPFIAAGEGEVTDSAVNAASAHHRPQTFLQWIVATADRMASGFEREQFEARYNLAQDRPSPRRARLLTLLEQIHCPPAKEGQLLWRYPLQALSPESIFPARRGQRTPRRCGCTRRIPCVVERSAGRSTADTREALCQSSAVARSLR